MNALSNLHPQTSAEIPVVEARGIVKEFGRKADVTARAFQKLGLAKPEPIVKAVSDVSLSIRRGEVLGLVGESGCGKSTFGRIVAGLIQATRGNLLWEGRDTSSLRGSERTAAKLKNQMVFQNPSASLNQRMSVGEIIGEAPTIHGLIGGDRDDFIDQQMLKVGLDPRTKHRLPHEFSGGQRQRVGIARALAVNPEFLVCDEAVAALDVSIQAQIINLFLDLRSEMDLTSLFISHDLGVIKHLSDKVAIMYLGRIVEQATTEEIFARANHPYTQSLLEEIPVINTEKRTFAEITGELPSPLNPPSGCHFHPRCRFAMERCRIVAPQLSQIGSGHYSACHLNETA